MWVCVNCKTEPSVCIESEWRTRYETQLDLNSQLERQIGVVQERLESLRGNPMGTKSIKTKFKTKDELM